MQKKIFLFLFSLFLFPLTVHGAEPDPLEIARRTQEIYENTASFQADFQQISSISGMSQRTRKGSGTMVIQKPGLLRWDYTTPETQVLVSDGEMFSLYFSSEQQMIMTPAREYLQEDITYNFFSGKGDVLRDFNVTHVPSNYEKEGYYAIQLTPRKTHAQVETLYVWVDTVSYMVEQLQILDHLGSTTDLMFSNMKLNEVFPKDYFHFTPPVGTEIIRQ